MGAWKQRNDSILLHTMSQQGSVALPLKCDRSTMGKDLDEAIRCTLPNCTCECFQPGKISLRTCDYCKHGWVAHALDKLSTQHLYHPAQVEIVQSSVVFDISSLMLYGTQALPVRLKILLDRLFSVLKQSEVLHILHCLGWTLRDYVRGYILQDAVGKVLDRWSIMSQEEEVVTLQQFLRFGETKSIVELMALQEQEGQVVTVPPSEADSGIRTFIESSGPARSPALLSCLQGGGGGGDSVHHFENLPNSLAFLLPFQYVSPGSAPTLGLPANGLAREPSLPTNGLVQEPGLPNQSEPSESRGSEASLSPCPSLGAPLGRLNPKAGLGGATPPPSPTPPPLGDRHAHPHALKLGPRGLQYSSLSCRPHRMRRMGAASRKGRVCCSSCGKTFYDKGTLKIHFNAVHLKIKHRCTVQGCNMVFSSLRSRNRHSANPNPRLHLPVLRNNRDRDLIRSATASATPIISGHAHMATPLLSAPPTPGLDPLLHGSLVFPSLKSVQPVQPIPPFYRALVPPAALVHPPVSLPSSLTPPASHSPRLPGQDPASESPPKKKPRKSSMPVKIEKEAASAIDEYEEEEEEEEEEEDPGYGRQRSPSAGDGSPGPAPPWLEERRGARCAERDHQGAPEKEPEPETRDGERSRFTERQEEEAQEEEAQEEVHGHLRERETESKICSSPPPLRPLVAVKEELSDSAFDSVFCVSRRDPKLGLHPSSALHPNTGLHPRTCYVCKKSFKSSYSVKLHYRNVHLKEMHLCTLAGCSAAFPSRRSRDRHSSNINLHRKLLTKELDHMVLDSDHIPLPLIVGGHERGLEALGRGGRGGGRGRNEGFSPINGASQHSPGFYVAAELCAASSGWSRYSAHSSTASDPGSSEGALLDDARAASDGEDISQNAEGLGDIRCRRSRAADWQPCDTSPSCHDSAAPSPRDSSPASHDSSPGPVTPPPSGDPCGCVATLSVCGRMLRCHARLPSARSRDGHSQNPDLQDSAPLPAMMD
ncbi:zinc finger protein basonuclin-2-like [Anguilla anguilla]|uniref:zinc finger protein basonuclin-2-like n=1 Tax=Anguilla anguilla TaxID=7936 RepID=UPI0015A82761|nr:zinc finger protein basonuclin-2-like [Anguilla anguilla]